MGTSFEKIYELFLGMIDSYEFAQVEDDELSAVLKGYLLNSLSMFTGYHKDLMDVDIEESCFNSELNLLEMNLVAKAMKLEWVRQKKYSEELMRKSIGDRDYDAVQGYKYLEELSNVENVLVSEIQSTLNQYEYSLSELLEEFN